MQEVYYVRNFLGLEADMCSFLGLEQDFTINIIKAVGNYGEISDRNFESSILPGGNNLLNTDFGLQYSPP